MPSPALDYVRCSLSEIEDDPNAGGVSAQASVSLTSAGRSVQVACVSVWLPDCLKDDVEINRVVEEGVLRLKDEVMDAIRRSMGLTM